MMTPDAGLIRVRWYRIPEPLPGMYDVTDYCSSDWDDTPKDFDPPLGEQSSTRDPFNDWRDCCPPPWPGYDENLCPLAQTPTFRQYTIPKFSFTCRFGEFTFPKSVATNTAECLWTTGTINLGAVTVIFRRSVLRDGLLGWFLLIHDVGTGQNDSCQYLPDAYTDWTGPFTVTLAEDVPHLIASPKTLTIRPVDPNVLALDRCFGIGTGAGDFLLIT